MTRRQTNFPELAEKMMRKKTQILPARDMEIVMASAKALREILANKYQVVRPEFKRRKINTRHAEKR